MTRLRLLLLIAGAGTLLAGLPAQASGAPPEPTANGSAAGDNRALELLSAASRAGRSRSYVGSQYVSTWRAGRAGSSVADVSHTAAAGSVVQVRPTAGGQDDNSVTPTADLDPRLVRLLATHYALRLSGTSSCAGRPARVVEARRPADDSVAGRFWVDDATSLLLRRETFDRAGRLLRSSAFTILTVRPTTLDVTPAVAASDDQLGAADIAALRADGWQVPAALAGDLELFDARMRTHNGDQVLHLSYSDGLMMLSLFAQRGRLGTAKPAGFDEQKLSGARVWVRPSTPERVVWGGGGRVFTLLSDAPTDTVRAAVAVLPHEKPPRKGLLARLGRGLARLGSWLNPFS